MSINTLELSPRNDGKISELPFQLFTNESEILRFSSATERQSLTISSHDLKSNVNIIAHNGYIYLTNKRFIFITSSQGDINSFHININFATSLQLTHKLKAPWFGPNYFEFKFFSASNPLDASDGLPKNQWFSGSISFKDGGLYDFAQKFDAVINDVVNNKDIDDELPQYREM